MSGPTMFALFGNDAASEQREPTPEPRRKRAKAFRAIK
jgi:hypothetical protein